VHGSRVTSGMVSIAFMYSVCVLGSPGALVHLGHWGTGSHGAPVHLGAPGHWFMVHLGHQCTSSHGAPVHMVHQLTWGTGSPGASVHLGHWFTWGTGSPGALVHWSSMTKHLCCPHYGL